MKPLRQLEELKTFARDIDIPRNYYAGRRHGPLLIPDNIILFIRRSFRELQDGTFLPHYHNRWVLVVPIEGTGTVIVDGGHHRLRPGRGLLVPPLRLHQYTRVSRRELCWLFVTFELPAGSVPASGARTARLTQAAISALANAGRVWVGAGHRAAREAEANRVAVEIALVWGEIMRDRPSGRHLSQQRAATLLSKINQWISEAPKAGAGLDALSRRVGLSESRLRMWFRQTFGLSLGRYVRETRCRMAALRLKSEDVSLSQLAEDLGFSSAFSFSRAFKNVLGVAPRRFSERRCALPTRRGQGGASRQHHAPIAAGKPCSQQM